MEPAIQSSAYSPQEVRLIHYVMRKQSRPEQKVWIYQYRNGAEKPWNSFYSFAELEFFQEDFEVMNRVRSWDARHKNDVWVVKFLRNGETNGLPLTDAEMKALTETQTRTDGVCVVGKIMLVNNVVKLNMSGRTRMIDAFETEERRMEALRRWFSIVL
ncbi:hypothetical protein NUU61_003519 [Penicillium alfredii]|uniref:Arylamine N-acetyltransferase n=1 Tax=Penicillium alfredii TaxID=1506179 RepID=A0A9W9KDR4_9EURO|nr:uncharacterized protein NUU61_003519 [Penicillium alfredii]KAJ5101297.1 hypothetical protein NUU61_003519 [Penicillium alfredii]